MSRVAYCSKCYRIVLASEVTGFDTCPNCNQKYKFTEINQHSWYLMTAEQKAQYKAKWFGSAHVANDTVKSFNEETGQEQPVTSQVSATESFGAKEEASSSEPIVENTFPMTQSDTFEGQMIKEYLGVVSGTCAVPTSALGNIDSSRQYAMDVLRKKCNELGANAAVSVKVDTVISDNLVIMTTTGTAVII